MDFPETERRLDGIEAHRQIGAPLSRTAGLVPDEIALRPYGSPAPNDKNALCGIKMFLNVLAPMSAPTDVGVPPDRESFCLERGY